MMIKTEYEVKFFPTPKEFEVWLEKEHEKTAGIWVKFARKGSGIQSITFEEALDVALCYGWIDGQGKSFDETYYLNKFTPRGKKSTWSKRNRENIERLLQEGRMKPAGLAVVAAAKEDGRWDLAYDSPSTMVIPEDFLKELKKDEKAHTFFQSLNKSNLYAIGWRLQTAKKKKHGKKECRLF